MEGLNSSILLIQKKKVISTSYLTPTFQFIIFLEVTISIFIALLKISKGQEARIIFSTTSTSCCFSFGKSHDIQRKIVKSSYHFKRETQSRYIYSVLAKYKNIKRLIKRLDKTFFLIKTLFLQLNWESIFQNILSIITFL